MKTLKFTPELAELILQGTKRVTWRFFDDKDLQKGDRISLCNSETQMPFAQAVISDVQIKKFSEIEEGDLDGHERYASRDEMLATYRGYYGDHLTWETPLKVIRFELQ